MKDDKDVDTNMEDDGPFQAGGAHTMFKICRACRKEMKDTDL